MDPIRGVTFVQGDFREDEGLAAVEAALDGTQGRPCAFRTSPPICRVSRRPIRHAPCIWASWRSNSRGSGCNLAAIWSSKLSRAAASRNSSASMQGHFDKVYVRKPKASRDRSREVYLVAKRLLREAVKAVAGS